jgi:hypothetical protein
VIRLSLLLVPESTTSLRGVWNEALPAVIDELEAGGYAVDRHELLEAAAEHGWLQRFGIEPGPATLTAAANTSGDGSIVFDLKGEKFGQKGLRCSDHDEALWDRLEALGDQLSAAHTVVATIGDPDFVTGGPGAPGTFLPGRATDEEDQAEEEDQEDDGR